jgi:hypothetical protein
LPLCQEIDCLCLEYVDSLISYVYTTIEMARNVPFLTPNDDVFLNLSAGTKKMARKVISIFCHSYVLQRITRDTRNQRFLVEVHSIIITLKRHVDLPIYIKGYVIHYFLALIPICCYNVIFT